LAAFWSLGIRPVVDIFLHPLESQYEILDLGTIKEKNIHKVVVLTGGGYSVRDGLFSSAFPHASVYRFLGGVELCARIGRDCELIFSGSAGRSRRELATAKVMEELELLIVPEAKVQSESKSGSTAEHAANLKPLVEDSPFLLVTSAIHMPRAMRSFRRAGLNPVAYPVDVLSSEGPYSWEDFAPSVENLWKFGVALREYQALIFYSLMK